MSEPTLSREAVLAYLGHPERVNEHLIEKLRHTLANPSDPRITMTISGFSQLTDLDRREIAKFGAFLIAVGQVHHEQMQVQSEQEAGPLTIIGPAGDP